MHNQFRDLRTQMRRLKKDLEIAEAKKEDYELRFNIMKDQHTELQEQHVKAENELLDLRERQ